MPQNHKMFFYKKDLTYERLCNIIKKGFSCIRHSFFPHSIKDEQAYDLVLTLSPMDYHSIPIAKVITFFLNLHGHDLGEMKETAIHEAFANTFLWGLLQLNNNNSAHDFEDVFKACILKKQHQLQTFSIGISLERNGVTITFINPYDNFNVNAFRKHEAHYIRGLDIVKKYSHVFYDAQNNTVQLRLESDRCNEPYAVAQ